MLLSIISITLSLLFLLVYCVMDIAGMYSSDESFINSGIGSKITESFDRAKVMFIFAAFIFDLYKWCVFIAATAE